MESVGFCRYKDRPWLGGSDLGDNSPWRFDIVEKLMHILWENVRISTALIQCKSPKWELPPLILTPRLKGRHHALVKTPSLNPAFSSLMAPIVKRAEKENRLHTLLSQSRL